MTIVSLHLGRNANLAFTDEEGVKHLDLEMDSITEYDVDALKACIKDSNVPTDVKSLALGKDSVYLSRHLTKLFNYRGLYFVGHHDAHAGYALAQSGYTDAIIISFGAGGNDGVTNVFHANSSGIHRIKRFPVNFGDAYLQMCYPISEIRGMKMENESVGHLPNDTDMCKQLEELAEEGEVIDNWVDSLSRYYISYVYADAPDMDDFVDFKYKGNRRDMGESLGLDLSINALKGEQSRNFAATNQKVFEQIFIGLISPLLDAYNHLPLILTGGCALNKHLPLLIRENKAYAEEGKLFIPKDPTNSTLSVGQLNYLAPSRSQYTEVSKIHHVSKSQ